MPEFIVVVREAVFHSYKVQAPDRALAQRTIEAYLALNEPKTDLVTRTALDAGGKEITSIRMVTGD